MQHKNFPMQWTQREIQILYQRPMEKKTFQESAKP